MAFLTVWLSFQSEMVRSAMRHWCTSSAPSANRAHRACFIISPKGVSELYPSAPWTWMARSMMRLRALATKCFAIETSLLKSSPRSTL